MAEWNQEGSSLRVRWVFGFLAAITLLVPLGSKEAAAAQSNTSWQAPEDAKKVENPEKSTPEGLAAAAELYQQNCMQCHGATGAGNGPSAGLLLRKPSNFTNAKVMNQATDGELFWKMTTGRSPMPSWSQLSDTQRWQLVNYIRSLAKKAPVANSNE